MTSAGNAPEHNNRRKSIVATKIGGAPNHGVLVVGHGGVADKVKKSTTH
jgi:hypothetical protein